MTQAAEQSYQQEGELYNLGLATEKVVVLDACLCKNASVARLVVSISKQLSVESSYSVPLHPFSSFCRILWRLPVRKICSRFTIY